MKEYGGAGTRYPRAGKELEAGTLPHVDHEGRFILGKEETLVFPKSRKKFWV